MISIMPLMKSVLYSVLVLIIIGMVSYFIKTVIIFTFPTNLVFLGLFFIPTGLLLRIWASYVFYKQKTKIISINPSNELFKDGPYKFSRNPLYLGVFLIFLGFGFLFNSFAVLISSILLLIIIHFYVIGIEEKVLGKRFGKKYVKYKKKVSRWISFAKL